MLTFRMASWLYRKRKERVQRFSSVATSTTSILPLFKDEILTLKCSPIKHFKSFCRKRYGSRFFTAFKIGTPVIYLNKWFVKWLFPYHPYYISIKSQTGLCELNKYKFLEQSSFGSNTAKDIQQIIHSISFHTPFVHVKLSHLVKSMPLLEPI